ncbi:HXXXD-type acyl-transferase family protein [Prunus dulcis]|uniref:HXXXD-type acyl-transferase family protein n=1 Tax=Prunus dulcis TaxID=3755 RepID=A0A4Y1S162_PRUDU|nr:HXXXD-type acyl-transferase family protein [Prunus dulcis]
MGWTSRYFHPHIGLHLYILHSQTAVERFAHEDKGDFATSLKHFRSLESKPVQRSRKNVSHLYSRASKT